MLKITKYNKCLLLFLSMTLSAAGQRRFARPSRERVAKEKEIKFPGSRKTGTLVDYLFTHKLAEKPQKMYSYFMVISVITKFTTANTYIISSVRISKAVHLPRQTISILGP